MCSTRKDATHTNCEIRIHHEYKYKLSLHCEGPTSRSNNSILFLTHLTLVKLDQSSYWVLAPNHDTSVNNQSQKRRSAAAATAFAATAPLLTNSTNSGSTNCTGCSWSHRKIGDCKKKTTGRNRTRIKKASETLQPERVPWAKMATVLIVKFAAKASLLLNKKLKKK